MRKPTFWLVPCVLLIAALLRFYQLGQRGLLYWDEGKFALEGLRLQAIVQGVLHHQSTSLAGKAVGTAKPTHALLIALSYALLGVHDYSPLFLDAAASVLQVVVVYLLGRRLFGQRVGVLAALFLAVSEYDVIYARSVLSESDANLLFICGVLIWSSVWTSGEAVTDRRRFVLPRALGGLLCGIAFTTNYRLIVYVAVLVGLDLTLSMRREGWRRALAAAGSWSVGLLPAPVTWEIVGLVAGARGEILFRGELTGRPATYFSEALYQLHQGKQSVFKFNPTIYLDWYAIRQGWPMLILVLAGLALAVRYRKFCWALPAALVLGPYVIYVFAPFIVPRNLDATLPFGAILAAATLDAVVRAVPDGRRRHLLLLVASLGVAALGAALTWRLTNVRSGFAAAAGYVQTHRADGAVIGNEVLVYYLRDGNVGCDAPRLTHDLTILARYDAGGYEYAIVDVYNSPTERYLLRHGYRVARYPVAGSISLGENPVASENGSLPGGHLDQHVDVYTIDSIKVPTARKSPLHCTLDQLG